MAETIAQSGSENYAVSVGAAATVIVEGGASDQSGDRVAGRGGGNHDQPREVTIHNAHATQVLYIGSGSDTSTSNGLPIPAGEYKVFLLHWYDELWAIASGASTDARVFILHGKGDPA